MTTSSITTSRVEMLNPKYQYQLYRDEIDEAVLRTLASGRYIMGSEVEQLEEELAAYCGSREAICCSSGTDALILALKALDVGPGDEVIVPDFTFIATAEAVAWANATPVFVDVRPTDFNIDPDQVEANITERTRGIIAVSLFGQCADMAALTEICDRHGLFLLEDAAQSFGAKFAGRSSCNLSPVAATSFYPSKPLGAYGDGGALFTDDPKIAEKLRRLLNHGQAARYEHRELGMNGRLDAVQAAVLRVKLRHLHQELAARRVVAEMYTRRLNRLVATPLIQDGRESAWAQYTIRIPAARDRVAGRLDELGVGTAVYYPIPLHRQPVFSQASSRTVKWPWRREERPTPGPRFPVTETLCRDVLSLPMHPFLTESAVETVGSALETALCEVKSV